MEQWYDEIENISINWLSKRQNSILVYDSMLSLGQSGLIRGCVLFVELVSDFHQIAATITLDLRKMKATYQVMPNQHDKSNPYKILEHGYDLSRKRDLIEHDGGKHRKQRVNDEQEYVIDLE